MNLLTEEEYNQLLENGRKLNEGSDDYPVVKLFLTNTDCCWLLCALSPDDSDIAFGLCDLEMGFPELGFLTLTELVHAQYYMRDLSRDENFKGQYPISVYSEAARSAQRIVTDETSLKNAALKLKIS